MTHEKIHKLLNGDRHSRKTKMNTECCTSFIPIMPTGSEPPNLSVSCLKSAALLISHMQQNHRNYILSLSHLHLVSRTVAWPESRCPNGDTKRATPLTSYCNDDDNSNHATFEVRGALWITEWNYDFHHGWL